MDGDPVPVGRHQAQWGSASPCLSFCRLHLCIAAQSCTPKSVVCHKVDCVVCLNDNHHPDMNWSIDETRYLERLRSFSPPTRPHSIDVDNVSTDPGARIACELRALTMYCNCMRTDTRMRQSGTGLQLQHTIIRILDNTPFISRVVQEQCCVGSEARQPAYDPAQHHLRLMIDRCRLLSEFVRSGNSESPVA